MARNRKHDRKHDREQERRERERRQREQQRKRKRQHKGGNGGGHQPTSPGEEPGGPADDVLAPGTTTAFATELPDAYIRQALGSAGYAPNDATNFARFLGEAIINPFVAGWDEWQASHPTQSDQDFWTYAQGRNMGLPANYTGGVAGAGTLPPGPGGVPNAHGPAPIGGSTGNPIAGQPASAPALSFDDWLKTEKGINKHEKKNLNKGRKQRLKKKFNAFDQGAGAADAPTPPPSGNGTVPMPPGVGPVAPPKTPADWMAFRRYVQNEIDRYTPQQQGVYDPGKRPGSVRYNLFS